MRPGAGMPRGRMLGLLVGAAVTLFWLGMMFSLVRDKILPHRRTAALASKSAEPRELVDKWQDLEEYMAIASGRKELGAALTRIVRTAGTKPGYQMDLRVGVNLQMLGIMRPVAILARAELDHRYDLDFFHIKARLGTLDWSIRGTANDNNELLLETAQGASVTRSRLGLERRISFLEAVRPVAARNLKIEVGQSISLPVIDPVWSLQRGYVEIGVVKKETIMVGGRDTEAYRVEARLNDFTSVSWVDKDGRTLKRNIVGGMVMEATTREHAERVTDIVKEELELAPLDSGEFTTVPLKRLERIADSKMSPLSILGPVFNIGKDK